MSCGQVVGHAGKRLLFGQLQQLDQILDACIDIAPHLVQGVGQILFLQLGALPAGQVAGVMAVDSR